MLISSDSSIEKQIEKFISHNPWVFQRTPTWQRSDMDCHALSSVNHLEWAGKSKHLLRYTPKSFLKLFAVVQVKIHFIVICQHVCLVWKTPSSLSLAFEIISLRWKGNNFISRSSSINQLAEYGENVSTFFLVRSIKECGSGLARLGQRNNRIDLTSNTNLPLMQKPFPRKSRCWREEKSLAKFIAAIFNSF